MSQGQRGARNKAGVNQVSRYRVIARGESSSPTGVAEIAARAQFVSAQDVSSGHPGMSRVKRRNRLSPWLSRTATVRGATGQPAVAVRVSVICRV